MNRPDLPNKPKPAPKSLTEAELRKKLRAPIGKRITMKNGGAANPLENCVSILLRTLPDKEDYERMVDLDCEAIDTTKSYKEFVNDQRAKAAALGRDDCNFLLALCKRVLNKRVSHLDLEGCTVFPTVRVFLDNDSKFVTVNDR